MEKLKLNYQEVSFIMDMKSTDVKELFLTHLEKEKVSVKDVIEVFELLGYFKPIKSLDERYDGVNELIFNLRHKSGNYKKYLSVRGIVKKKKFNAGKAVFYKICTPEQLAHAKLCFEENHKTMFPKNKTD